MTRGSRVLLVALVGLGAVLGPTSSIALATEGDQPDALASPSPTPTRSVPGAEMRARIAGWTERLEVDPHDTEALLGLGYDAYQLWRETGDSAELDRAEDAFARALAADADDLDALIGSGTVALACHDFAVALDLGRRALDVEPRSARAYGVVADALVELGRYEEAVDAVQAMVDLRPDAGSYARVSHLRELFGDLRGAIAAMEQAVLAGGPVVENTEYLRVVLGDLRFLAGDLDRAEEAYEAALQRLPGYVPALLGRARLAAARGGLTIAIKHYTNAAASSPHPEIVIALGEAQEAAGDPASADTYERVREIASRLGPDGVTKELDLVLFEVDHGDRARGLELARVAYAAAPNVRAADVLAWALHRTGAHDEARRYAEEALRLGSLEPVFHYHAGMIAKAQGDATTARVWLAESLRRNAAWSPIHAPRAAAALAELGEGPVASQPPMG